MCVVAVECDVDRESNAFHFIRLVTVNVAAILLFHRKRRFLCAELSLHTSQLNYEPRLCQALIRAEYLFVNCYSSSESYISY